MPETFTGTLRDIVENARVAGEDWGHRAPTVTDAPRVTIPPRSKSATWHVGDCVIVGRVRWIIRWIRGEHVELTSSNIASSAVRWTTTLTNLPARSAA